MSLKLSFQETLQISAFIPTYSEGTGQALSLFFCNGSTGCIELGLRSFIIQLAGIFAINMKEARKKYSLVLGQTNLIPLVLAPFLIYLPIKVRTPRVSGDSAYGYFRFRSIIETRQNPAPCTLELEGGHKIIVNQSFRTVRNRIRSGKKLEELLLAEYYQIIKFMQENDGQNGIKELEAMKGANAMELRNLVEDLVYQRIDEIKQHEKGMCTCEHCRLDIAAIALNQLPPRYTVTQRGEIYSRAEALEVQRYVDIVAAVNKAVRIVQKKPRHE